MKSRYIAQGQDDAVYAYLRGLAVAEEEAELGRLLYVGCTRAKERLHLTSSLELTEEEGQPRRWKEPSTRTALAALWPAISASASEPGADIGRSVSREETGVPLWRLPADWRLPPPPAPISDPSRPDSMSDRDSVEFDWARETARRIGTVAHRLLSQLAGEESSTGTCNESRANASESRASLRRSADRQRSRRSRGAGAVGDRGNHLRLTRTLVVRSRPRRGAQRICVDRAA